MEDAREFPRPVGRIRAPARLGSGSGTAAPGPARWPTAARLPHAVGTSTDGSGAWVWYLVAAVVIVAAGAVLYQSSGNIHVMGVASLLGMLASAGSSTGS